jgi:rRNA processing protein Gar1
MGTFMHASEGEMVCTSTNVKIPYFNAPIYLENKTAVGKVDEILGPINQVYFTIKPQEGIVATSFKNGDKFFIGGDKLLPLERYISSRRPYCNTHLTYSLDSCPSLSPLPVLPRSRSPQVAAALVAVLVTEVGEDFREGVAAIAVAVASPRAVAAPSEVEVDREAASVVVIADVGASLRAVGLVALEVAVVAEAVVATKRLASHLDTQKGAKHEGVNRQRRHGVMKPMDGLGKLVFARRQFIFMFYAVQDYILRYRDKRSTKKLFQLSFVWTISTLLMFLAQHGTPSTTYTIHL